MLKKDDELVLAIEDMGNEGEGVARHDGLTLFVKDAIPKDIIKAKIMKMKKGYGYARMMEIISPSKDRVEPVCPVARACGGCQLQHASYESQLKFKERKVVNCLKRIGGLDNADELMEPIIGMDNPWNYRNKAQFPVGIDKDGKVKIGFYASHSHNIIDIDSCCIQDKINEPIIAKMRQIINEYKEELMPYDEKSGKGVLRHIITRVGATTGETCVCLVINKDYLKDDVKKLIVDGLLSIAFEDDAVEHKIVSITLNINKKMNNVIMGDELICIYGKDYITDYIGDIKYEISPLSFYQVNPIQTKKLYDTALEFANLTGDENVWDLYCGIGTISLFLARKAKQVIGVEIIPAAVENAKRNAVLNGFTNTQFHVGSAQDVVTQMYEDSNGELKADVVVVDPPRKGCDVKLLETIVKMSPKRLVYVSCDPATLARDIKWLGINGYGVERVRCTDMFGMGAHVETVVLMSRKDK